MSFIGVIFYQQRKQLYSRWFQSVVGLLTMSI